MDFQFHHSVPADPEEVAEVLLDRKFQASLSQLEGLRQRKVLSQKKEGDVIHRRIRCVLDVKVTGVAKKFLGDGDAAWVEHATWHPDEMLWRWEVEPEVGGDLLEASGTIELQPAKKGTKRLVTGKIKVRVPVYGSRVEGWVVEGLKSAYEDEAGHLTEWLEST
jgi:hypothetical protein